MDNSEMIEIFFEIDENEYGSVSKKDLISHLNKRDFNEKEIESFMEVFEDSNEEISFEEYCLQIGEDVQDYDYPRAHKQDIEIINSKCLSFHREWVTANIIRRTQSAYQDKKEIAERVKKALDKQMNELWHCVIVKGQYWAYYSHEPGCSIVLKHQNNIFILFKTPGN